MRFPQIIQNDLTKLRLEVNIYDIRSSRTTNNRI